MALSTTGKALAILLGIDEVLLKGKGVAARAARASFRATAKAIVAGGRFAAPAVPVAARGAGLGLRGAAALARRHPLGALGAAGLAAHELGYLDPAYELIERERQMAAQQYAIAAPTILPELERTYIAPVKRKVSKANKAVKAGMAMLKAGTKRTTGAPPGKLPKGAFSIATKAAGLAHPGTPSGIRIGKSVTKLLARKLKKWWKK
jgi:hypothetical protein